MDHSIRYKIYNVLESDSNNKLSTAYDVFMLICIFFSLIPLMFKEESELFWWFDKLTVLIFIIDYLLRWATADYKYNSKSIKSFIKYPISPMAIVDLLSILPSLTFVNNGFKALRLVRALRALKVLKLLKLVRYSNSIQNIAEALKRSYYKLLIVTFIALIYIFTSALLVFNFEPDTFSNFFDALYWATVSLTTVGYGDIYPVTTVGRIISMISTFIGVAIIALPASIITSDYMEVLHEQRTSKKQEK